MRIFAIFLFFLVSTSSFSQNKAELISFEKLDKKVNAADSRIYVVNFWATWCGPCLKELPAIEQFYATNKNPKVKLLLVSFDFPSDIKKVNKFIEKKGLKPPIYLISDTDQNAFINKVSSIWEGTIPATWFVNNKNNKKLFIEKPLNLLEINRYINEIEQ